MYNFLCLFIYLSHFIFYFVFIKLFHFNFLFATIPIQVAVAGLLWVLVRTVLRLLPSLSPPPARAWFCYSMKAGLKKIMFFNTSEFRAFVLSPLLKMRSQRCFPLVRALFFFVSVTAYFWLCESSSRRVSHRYPNPSWQDGLRSVFFSRRSFFNFGVGSVTNARAQFLRLRRSIGVIRHNHSSPVCEGELRGGGYNAGGHLTKETNLPRGQTNSSPQTITNPPPVCGGGSSGGGYLFFIHRLGGEFVMVCGGEFVSPPPGSRSLS